MGWMETVTQAVTQEGGAVSRSCWSSSSSHNNEQCKMLLEKEVCIGSRPSQLAKLYRREFDPELLSDPCRGSDLETAFWLLTCNLRNLVLPLRSEFGQYQFNPRCSASP